MDRDFLEEAHSILRGGKCLLLAQREHLVALLCATDPWDYRRCKCENNGDFCEYCAMRENLYGPSAFLDTKQLENGNSTVRTVGCP